MKSSYLILFSLLGLIALSNASAQRGESIMFKPQEHPSTKPPQSNEGKAGECTRLAKQIEALKGKPQRRHAALERYRLLCSDKTQLK
jgi:hypothetical protein